MDDELEVCGYCGKHHRGFIQSVERSRAARRRAAKYAKHDCLMAYGGNPPKCNCCGETEEDFLTIDHINGDGATHRKEIGYSSIMFYLRKRGFPDKDKLQVLCFNCNLGKRVAGGVCPHKKEILTKS